MVAATLKTMVGLCHVVFLALLARTAMCSLVVIVEPDPSSYVYAESPKQYLPTVKRGGLYLGFPEMEDVCKTKLIAGHRPQAGHLENGSRVEIRQDEDYEFVATFVECSHSDRPPCHGIDHKRFTSECVTVFEHRTAQVRLAVSSSPYVEGLVRVPIACQCQLRRIPSIFQR